jgi:acetyl esterase/lipase
MKHGFMNRRNLLQVLAGVVVVPGGRAAVVAPQRGIVYSTAGGERLALDLWKAPQPGLRPVVMCIHGGGWRGGNRGDMAPFAAEFAAAGFTAVTVSYRLHDPVKSPQHVWPAAFDDVQRAVRWLRENAGALSIDPGKIVALGASAGGHLAALLGLRETRKQAGPVPLSHETSRVNGVIDVFGPSDLTKDFSAVRVGGGSVQDLVDDFIGRGKTEKQRAEDRRDASPVAHVDGSAVPFLIFHGALDPIVPVEQGRILDTALRRAGRDCRYVEWAREGHGLGAPGSMESFRRETMAFLRKVASS